MKKLTKKQKIDIVRIIAGFSLIILGYYTAIWFEIDYRRDLMKLVKYVLPLFLIMTGIELLRVSIKWHIRCYQARNWKKIKRKCNKKKK